MLKTPGCPVLFGRSNRGVYSARLYEQITIARDGITELTDGRRREIYSFISSLVSSTKKQAYYQHKFMASIVEVCDLTTISKGLDKALTDIDSCYWHWLTADENKLAWELIASNCWLYSHISMFLIGIECLPLLECLYKASVSREDICIRKLLWFTHVKFHRSQQIDNSMTAPTYRLLRYNLVCITP